MMTTPGEKPNIERQSRKKKKKLGDRLTGLEFNGELEPVTCLVYNFNSMFEESCSEWVRRDHCTRREDELTASPGKKK